jgi:DNA-binding response OmpR family regulator
MYKKSILIVDDERSIVKGLKLSLEQEGFEIKVAYDGERAYNLFNSEKLDLIIMDLMLPEIDGFSLCKMIRQKSNIPIIMLTARTEDVDKIVGLEIGADDYLEKPCNTRELIARIRAILRRVQDINVDISRITIRNISIDILRRKVFIDDSKICLTDKEFELLLLLAKNAGVVYSRDNLLELVWGYNFIGDSRTVDVHVRRLREKIEENPAEPQYILTKWGVGYYFQELS